MVKPSARTAPSRACPAEAGNVTVKAFQYETLESLKVHTQAYHGVHFGPATQGAAMANALPGDLRCKDSAPFRINPHHLIPGPHTSFPFRATHLSNLTFRQ
jgi:hypothetical protein